MIAVNTFDPNLRLIFLGDDLQNLQNCVKHCNIQLKNEQRSWTATISGYSIDIVKCVACAVITRVAVNYVLSSSLIFLPFVASSMLYTTFKLSSLKKEAKDTLTKTRENFVSVFSEYVNKDVRDMFWEARNLTFPEYVNSQRRAEELEKNLQRKKDCEEVYESFLASPKKVSSLQTVEKINAIITKHGDSKGLGTLSKMVLMQMIKDQRCLDKISSYQRICNWGMFPMLLTAQCIDELIRPCLFLVSKSLNIALITFTAVVVGGSAVNTCINHYKDQEIGKNTFRDLLPELNDVLEIPKELHA